MTLLCGAPPIVPKSMMLRPTSPVSLARVYDARNPTPWENRRSTFNWPLWYLVLPSGGFVTVIFRYCRIRSQRLTTGDGRAAQRCPRRNDAEEGVGNAIVERQPERVGTGDRAG